MKNLSGIIKGDKVIWAVVFFLSVFSIIAVYSSTLTLAYNKQAGNTEYYLVKHIIILLFGFSMIYIAHLFKYTYYSRLSQLALIVVIPLLIITLFFGSNINESNRWLTLPIINLTIQTSDVAKLVLIMYVARLLSKKQEQIKDFKTAFIPIMIPVIIVCGLILPSNFSTAGILFLTVFLLMFIGGIKIKYLFNFLFIALVGLSLYLLVLQNTGVNVRTETWKSRIESFFEKNEQQGYQVEQAKIAIARGGVLGKLPGNSIQKNFVPHPYSDFIFAIIIEEYGLIGGIIVVLLYMILLFRGIRIVTKSPGTFGAFLTFGLTFIIVFQAMINMAVAVNILPVTGQPLPFISMGGTSIWFTSLSIGIILSVSKVVETPDNVHETGEKDFVVHENAREEVYG